MPDRRVQYFAEMLKALGSEARLKIVRSLIQAGEPGCCVGDIQREVGMAGSTLSHHLDRLARVGVLTPRKEAQWIYYSVNYKVLRELLSFLYEDCCSRSSQLVELKPFKTPG